MHILTKRFEAPQRQRNSVLVFLAYSNERIIFFTGHVDLRVQRVKDTEKQLQVEQDLN
jgi:hypothetical protein